jgi:hypothetical protein
MTEIVTAPRPKPRMQQPEREQPGVGVGSAKQNGNGRGGDDDEAGDGDRARPDLVGEPPGEAAAEQGPDALRDEHEPGVSAVAPRTSW